MFLSALWRPDIAYFADVSHIIFNTINTSSSVINIMYRTQFLFKF